MMFPMATTTVRKDTRSTSQMRGDDHKLVRLGGRYGCICGKWKPRGKMTLAIARERHDQHTTKEARK